jgi:hypothetical protein
MLKFVIGHCSSLESGLALLPLLETHTGLSVIAQFQEYPGNDVLVAVTSFSDTRHNPMSVLSNTLSPEPQ